MKFFDFYPNYMKYNFNMDCIDVVHYLFVVIYVPETILYEIFNDKFTK